MVDIKMLAIVHLGDADSYCLSSEECFILVLVVLV